MRFRIRYIQLYKTNRHSYFSFSTIVKNVYTNIYTILEEPLSSIMFGKKKERRAIVVATTEDYLFALATLLVNLQRTNSNLYDAVVVLHDCIGEGAQLKLAQIEPKIEFRRITLTDWMGDVGIDQECIEKSETLKQFLSRYSHLPLSKYLLFKLLKEFDKVLMLDLDVLITGSISELFEYEGIAWRDGIDYEAKAHRIGLDEVDSDEFAAGAHVPAPNGGLLYLSRYEGFDADKCLEDARSFLRKYSDCIGTGFDEMMFAFITRQHSIPLTHLDPKVFNALYVFNEYSNETRIVHFMRSFKPWNNKLLQIVFPSWMNYYKRAGGKAAFPNEHVIDYEVDEKSIQQYLTIDQTYNDFFVATTPAGLPLEFESGFTAYSDGTQPTIKRRGDTCYLAGQARPIERLEPLHENGGCIFYHLCTVPPSLRPNEDVNCLMQGSGSCQWSMRVSSNSGYVTLHRYRNENGLQPISNTTWLPFNISWVI